jgi:hypothetical protein
VSYIVTGSTPRCELHLGSLRVKLELMASAARSVGWYGLHHVYSLVLLVMLTAASSCASTPVGEFTAEACTDGADNDRDTLRDCDDPDCWVFCPMGGNVEVGDASSSDPADASTDAMSKPMPDSGKPSAVRDEDGGDAPADAAVQGDDDGGAAPDPCKCPQGQSCIDGQCRPNPSPTIAGMYTLRVTSALVPLGPDGDHCFDYSAPGCLTKLPVVCDCQRPDPYVVVVQNKSVLSPATTPEVRDTVNAQWNAAPSVVVTLKATDTLTFRAFDWDGLGQDQPIFDCMPDLSVLSSDADALSCNPRPGSTANPPAGSSYSITASFVRVRPDAGMP